MTIIISNKDGKVNISMDLNEGDTGLTDKEIMYMVSDMFSTALTAVALHTLDGVFDPCDYVNCICKNAKERIMNHQEGESK